ncbi:MAG: multidrug efflux RND transporter permease subunit [Deltaproteobacteria bacterium]|nr:MAG: multidrug efflux RND transporter permease subunit [Deltaproteobacteria bacterium]
MFSRFFIERPIFATVLAIVIVIAGGVTVFTLPVAQYPEITPPTVEVSTVYPGANAKVVAETVAAPIEQEVNGVEDMIYMSSTCASDGSYVLTVTFDVGTDLDMASILVQNRVAIAEPRLPEEVKRQGVTTKKKSTAIVQLITLISPDGRYDDIYLSNYATLRIRDELSRIQGVGDVKVFGASEYSMRVWLDPERLESRSITTQDVIDAISEQNVQVAAGQIGQPPAPSGQSFQYTINTLGRLEEIEQFEQIIVKTEAGRVTRLEDVARLELGGQTYDLFSELSGVTAASLAIYQLPGANALQVADRVSATMERLSANFPEGVEYKIPFDTTIFVRQSIDEVYLTLFQAALLVFLVIYVFLQDWRASIVPAVTIPVSLIGTFAVMGALGFSVNLTTLFGLVLAIGIVVDDAIVVVENTSRHIDQSGMAARPAAIRAMQEVTGPVIATTLVLLAVFVPTAFLPGITGQLYRQFGLTIATATVFSSINALTLSPALCALLLKPAPEHRNVFFRAFNWGFERAEAIYGRVVASLLRRSALSMLAFAGLTVLALGGFASLPTGFLPEEDQGYLVAGVQLPDAASQERTREVVARINAILKETPGVAEWVTIGGNSLLDATVASNAATFYVVLDPFEARGDASLSQDAILGKLRQAFFQIEEGIAFVFVPPAIFGLGVAGGFQMELQDRGGLGFAALQQTALEMVNDGNAQSGLVGLNTTFRASVPQLFVDVNRTQAKRMLVPLGNVFGTLQAYLGSAYVNDFNKFGRTYQVRVQADHGFRVEPDDIKRLYVRNANGGMVPMGALVNVDEAFGPQIIRRYNLHPSASINGQAAPGTSSGEGLVLMEQMAAQKLPAAMGFEWTGMSYQEKQVGGEATLIFALAITLVFLVLAAQYESWTAPTSIILAVPFAILGVVIALLMRGLANDVYTQIGVVLLIGLASKTAILIVEFAREMRAGGAEIVASAVEAARLRFRPVLMTAISFVFGTLPLLVASGAGAASRQAVGTAVFGGMLVATFLTVLLVPVFYRVFQAVGERFFGESLDAPAAESEPGTSIA